MPSLFYSLFLALAILSLSSTLILLCSIGLGSLLEWHGGRNPFRPAKTPQLTRARMRAIMARALRLNPNQKSEITYENYKTNSR